jgi:uncharacterized protein
MKIEIDELASVVSHYNPWWRDANNIDVPAYRRAAFTMCYNWVASPPAARAVLLSGARQVGKTTLILQVIQELIRDGVPPSNILYVTFDHPLIKLAGIDAVIAAWQEREILQDGAAYLFLDEAQFMRDWGTWIKHQVDFHKRRRILFTGSATPLLEAEQESGVGRWHNIKLATLSFYEFLNIKKLALPQLEPLQSLELLATWSPQQRAKTAELATAYIPHFHDYLLRGGFPQTALVANVTQAQKLLREDMIDKVFKRDMTALFGVRRILDLEHLFLYMCRHDGGLLDMKAICSNLEMNRATVQHFIELLEATHLLHRLEPFGYGKEVLRGNAKIYLADAAIAPAVMLKGSSLLDDASALGVAVETTICKHLYSKYRTEHVSFSYWRSKDKKKAYEVDIIMEQANQLTPIEVKYRNQHTTLSDLAGLLLFCTEKKVAQGYVVTKNLHDFGLYEASSPPIFRIPALLLCYWLGELEQQGESWP